jgi:hypothetical protein
MISLHAGRLLLVCSRSDRTWHARVVLGPKAEHQLEADTGASQLSEALPRAQAIYREAVARIRPPGGPLMCWDCLQWSLTQNRCELGMPEAKRSGGRYATHCEMYQLAVKLAD